jgi:S1-C subfamily serine protease
MTITADFAGGSSGAAVFGASGNVVGMVAATRSVTSGKEKNQQMVIKMCVPAKSILGVIEEDAF